MLLLTNVCPFIIKHPTREIFHEKDGNGTTLIIRMRSVLDDHRDCPRREVADSLVFNRFDLHEIHTLHVWAKLNE